MLKKLLFIIIFTLSLLGLVLFILESRPDRGGITECEREMQIEGLSIYLSSPNLIFPWKPYEEPKFRFKLKRNVDLKKYLISSGYTNWKRGGIEFGSISVGDEPYEDHIYASRNLPNGKMVFVSISNINNEVIFVLRN